VPDRSRLKWAVAAAPAILIAAAAVAASGPGDASRPGELGGRCPIGGAPTNAIQWRRVDRRRVRELIVLGCGRLADGRRFELVARRFPRRRFFCLDAYFPRRRAALECGALPQPQGGPIDVSAFAPPRGRAARRLDGAVVTGAASAKVARVELVFARGGSERRRRAALVRVRDPELLRRLRLRRPFGFHASAPPRTVEGARIDAFDGGGRLLGQVPVPQARGEGGKCPRRAARLPPGAVARAALAALAEAPRIYRGIDTRGARLVGSVLATGAGIRGQQVRRTCGTRTERRSIVVELLFPRMRPSASLSQGTVFVSLIRGRYRVWEVAH
jgi:hypothetical protein